MKALPEYEDVQGYGSTLLFMLLMLLASRDATRGKKHLWAQ